MSLTKLLLILVGGYHLLCLHQKETRMKRNWGLHMLLEKAGYIHDARDSCQVNFDFLGSSF